MTHPLNGQNPNHWQQQMPMWMESNGSTRLWVTAAWFLGEHGCSFRDVVVRLLCNHLQRAGNSSAETSCANPGGHCQLNGQTEAHPDSGMLFINERSEHSGREQVWRILTSMSLSERSWSGEAAGPRIPTLWHYGKVKLYRRLNGFQSLRGGWIHGAQKIPGVAKLFCMTP